MTRRRFTGRALAVSVTMAALTLAACGEGGAVADIPFAEVRQAMDGGSRAFDAYFPSIKGTTVRWTGRVVDSYTVMGDHYMEQGYLKVDLDTGGPALAAADVSLRIPVPKVDAYNPGDPVTFVGSVIRFERKPEGVLLVLELDALEAEQRLY